MTRHRWPKQGTTFPNKTERECLNRCGTINVTLHEFEGGRSKDGTEFWRGLDRIECAGTPACEPVLETAAP